MNKEHVLFHLKEAREALEQIIQEIKSDPEYDDAEYSVDMRHLYHHVNTAWNGRDAIEAEVNECSEENFDRWRQYPVDDLEMF